MEKTSIPIISNLRTTLRSMTITKKYQSIKKSMKKESLTINNKV